MSAPFPERACWCGHPGLEEYSDDYRVCRACGTLVSRAPLPPEAFTVTKDSGELYSQDYWKTRQTGHHGLPDIVRRARLDLPERCTHWLRHLLPLRPPPARILEVGCAHGGYVALLGWAGYEAMGTELSPWVAGFARETFGVNVLAGPVESLPLPEGGFDVVVLNDVIEHLPDPVRTMTRCAQLVAPRGFFVIQTPEYKEHLGYADLRAANDLFLRHMDRNNDEHLYLYSRRAVGLFFGRLGFSQLEFSEPVYPYDMVFTASRSPLPAVDPATVESVLARLPVGRLVQALLDKAAESADRGWAIRRLEDQLKSRQP